MVWERLLLVLGLLCMLQAAASLDPLYEGWVSDGETKETLSFLVGTTSVHVQGNASSAVISFSACGGVNAYYVCIDNTSLSSSPKKVYVRILLYKHDFTITRSLNKTIGWYNDWIEVSVNITNVGSIDAPSVLYTDVFPQGLEVYINQTGSQGEQTYTYQGNISKGGTLALRYFVKPTGPVSATLRSELAVGGLVFYSNLASLVTKLPLNMSLAKAPHPAIIGDGVNLTVFVKHQMNRSASLNVTVRLPQSLTFADGSRTKAVPFSFTDNRTLNVTLVADAVYEGNEPILLDAVADNGLQFLLDELPVSMQVLAPVLVWDAQVRETVVSGTYEPLYLALVNQETLIKGLSVTLASDLFARRSLFFDTVSPEERLILLSEDVLLPEEKSSKTYAVNATYEYTTAYGELITKTWGHNMTVGTSSNVSVSYDVSGTLRGGEIITVTVKLTNAIDAPLTAVSVHDELDAYLFHSGTNANQQSLGAQETKTAYVYTLKLPYVSLDTTYLIRTFVSYKQGEEPITVEAEKSLVVQPKEEIKSSFSLTATLTPQKLSNTSIGSRIPVSLSLENKEDITFKNIIVTFPLDPRYELVGDPEFTLDRLDPSERISLDRVFFIRPLRSGSLDPGPATVHALDEAGNFFSGESNDPGSFDVSSAVEAGPLLAVNHSRVSFVENGAVYALTLENLGTAALRTTFNYNRQREEIYIMPKEKKEVKYTVFFPTNGNYTIPPILARYDHNGEGHRAYAQGDSIRFTEYVAPKQQVILPSKQVLDPADGNATRPYIVAADPSFFSRSSLIMTVIIVTIIILIIIFYEIRKHKL